ncbi:MAG: HD-GYP domain-containing protein, partial [Spirochaetaceae bacterium]|nr:HD-GYP domain-containing protein [Spirochaetaceae bacterium]
MNTYKVKEIEEGSLFSAPLYLDKHFILATPTIQFTKELAATLLEWQFHEVYSAGEPRIEEVVVS